MNGCQNRYILAIGLALVATSLASHAQQPRKPWTASRLRGTPTPPPRYAIRPAFPELSFDKPTSLEEVPGNRFLVAEIGGRILTFDRRDPGVGKADTVLRIEDASLWHATVHPRFEENWSLFACYSKKGTTHVSRFRIDPANWRAVEGSEEILLTWPAGGHNGGCLAFGKDGMLYISTGDGSGPNPPDGRTAGQDVSNLFGCILRINVNEKSDGKNYSIPADNPFSKMKSARGEIWAYGLRNPWKFGIDQQTGRTFAADNGWETWEMIHEIRRGGNCGWPIMEGRAVLRPEVPPGPTPILPPLKDHHHSEANSVIGGPVYRGNPLQDLEGTFVYGDYITGTIWGVTPDEEGSGRFETLVDTDLRIIAFAQSRDGRLFVVDYDYTGKIYEIVPSGLKDQSRNFPRLLSQTGIFQSLEGMKPAEGVIEYGVNVQRWTDETRSRRWIGIPGQATVTFATAETPARYPEGTVLVKHLWFPGQEKADLGVPVETQVLQFQNGTWHPYSYVWQGTGSSSGSDARLVDAEGGNFDIPAMQSSGSDAPPRRWRVSAVNECRLCHNAGSGFVLGFHPHQLHRSVTRSSNLRYADQLQQLQSEQVIAKAPPISARDPQRLVDPHDETQSLEDRARSYLHGNCSSCHHPGGNAIVSFYLKREMPFAKLNTNKGTGIGTFGMKNAKLIVPGDPYRSVLFYRMMKLGYARMPYIGTYQVDSRGVALIEQWIRNMPSKNSNLDSAPLKTSSPERSALAKLEAHGKPLPASDPSIRQLVGSTEGALALAASMHAGRSRTNSEGIYRQSEPDIRGLFESFVAPSKRRKTLGNQPAAESILSLDGNRDRGRLIFTSDGARCANCHHPSDSDRSVGPTLAEIRKNYQSRADLLQNILKPDLKVDEKFRVWMVATAAGKTFSGIRILDEPEKRLVLRTAEGKEISIAYDDVESVKKGKSLMPRNILADLTAQEAADLLEWFLD